MKYDIYADNKFIGTYELETAMLVIRFLYTNYDYTRVRIERRTEDE